MKIHNFEQYSEEWWEARRGLPTASEFSKIVTPTGKLSTQAQAYIFELIAETYTREQELTFEPSAWMLRGLELEPEARDWVAFDLGERVKEVGLVTNNGGKLGASPDGIIGKRIPLEIKCPKASTHVRYSYENKLPDTYKAQVHGQMIVCGSTEALFVSYHPELDPFVFHVERDEYTEALDAALTQFLKQYAAVQQKMAKRWRSAA